MALKYIWSVILSIIFISPAVFSKSCEVNIYAKFFNPVEDPIKAITWWDKKYVSLVYSTLIRYDENGNLIPSIAKSWKVESKNNILKLTLNTEIYAQDGSQITADDVIYTLNRIKSEPNPDKNKLKNLVKIIKKGPFELHLQYKDISSYDIYLLATPRLSIYKRGHPKIGTGPWKLQSSTQSIFRFTRARPLEASRNCINLVAHNYSFEMALKEFEKGNLDLIEYISLGQDEHSTISTKVQKIGKIHPVHIFDTTVLFYSKQDSDLTDERKSLLSLLYNNKKLTLNSNDKLAMNIVPPGVNKLYSEKIDINQKINTKIKPQTIWIPDSVEYKGVLIDNLKTIFKEARLPFTIKEVTLGELYRLHSKKKVNFHLETITLQTPHPYGVLSLFNSKSEENFTGFNNKQFDDYIKNGLSLTESEGHQYFSQASKLLIQSGYAIPLVNQVKYVLIRNNIQNYNFSKISTYHEYYSTLEKEL